MSTREQKRSMATGFDKSAQLGHMQKVKLYHCHGSSNALYHHLFTLTAENLTANPQRSTGKKWVPDHLRGPWQLARPNQSSGTEKVKLNQLSSLKYYQSSHLYIQTVQTVFLLTHNQRSMWAPESRRGPKQLVWINRLNWNTESVIALTLLQYCSLTSLIRTNCSMS